MTPEPIRSADAVTYDLRPECYSHLSESQWERNCREQLASLQRLAAEEFGAAEWALRMLAAGGGPGSEWANPKP